MIKLAAEGKDGRRLIGLGLSRENCARLLMGYPIIVDGAELGHEGLEIFIFGGDTEEEMVDKLKEVVGKNAHPQTSGN